MDLLLVDTLREEGDDFEKLMGIRAESRNIGEESESSSGCDSGGVFTKSSTSLPGADFRDSIVVEGEMVFGDWNWNGDSEAGLRVSPVSVRTDCRLGPLLRGVQRKGEGGRGIGASCISCENGLGWEGSVSTF